MKNDKTLKKLWQETTRGAQITIKNEQLFVSLQKASRHEKLMRAYEFSDILGGFILSLIVVLFIINKPATIMEIPILGKIGIALFAGTFLLYHYRAFKIKRVSLPKVPTWIQLVNHEKEKLDRRIVFLSNFAWYLLTGLSGLFFLFVSLNASFKGILIPAIFFISFGAILYYMVRKDLKKKYLPLRRQIDEKLQTLAETSNSD